MDNEGRLIFGCDPEFVTAVMLHTLLQEDLKMVWMPAIGKFRLEGNKVFFDLDISEHESQLLLTPEEPLLLASTLNFELPEINQEAVLAVLYGKAKYKGYIVESNEKYYSLFVFGDISAPDEILEEILDRQLIDMSFKTYNIRSRQDFEPYIEKFLEDLKDPREKWMKLPPWNRKKQPLFL